MKRIPLTRGEFALVDDSAFQELAAHKWHCFVTNRGQKYAARNVSKVPRVTELMHRRVTQAARGRLVDHRNGNSLDNRKRNLRVCSSRQNSRNASVQRRPKSSRFKGVSWHAQRSRWVANICVNYRTRYLGLYSTEAEAARAYDAAARVHFGRFAALNFPGRGERRA